MTSPALDPATVTRFAPSPTGLLHLGHAYAALIAYGAAAAAGGRFFVRLEDIDETRCRPAFAAAILEDLAWLGLGWEASVRQQSAHMADYRAALDVLGARGLLYPCFCSRKDIAASASAPQGPMGALYPGTCRNLTSSTRARRIAAGGPYVLRLDVERAVQQAGDALSFEETGAGPAGEHGRLALDPRSLGDVVLARKDTPASYHLCVTVDDAVQGITLVTRGADLFPATAVHRLLQALLDLPVPRYHHHRLICDASGRRLAKRDNAETLEALRATGLTPPDVRRRLGL